MSASSSHAEITLPPTTEEAIIQEPPRRWRLTTFSALKYRNYRLYFFGQMISLIGSWLQTTALMSLAHDLGAKASWPPTVVAAQLLPTLVLGAWAGTLVDRWPKRALIFTTQALQLVLALVLAAVCLLGLPQVDPELTCWLFVLIALLTGIVNALDLPARMSFVIEMVGRADLVNAVALNSMLFNTARAVGPFFAAILLALLDPGYCFLINGLSFLAVLGALAWMDVPDTTVPSEHTTLAGLRAAWSYVLRRRGLFWLLFLSGGVAFLAGPVNSLLPALSHNQIHAGRDGYALMLSGVGCGALVGAFCFATFGCLRRRFVFFTCGIACTVTALVFLAVVHWLPLAVMSCVLFGIGPSLYFSTGQSTVQLSSTDANRGRVLGIWSMATAGTLPVGNLVAGFAADRFGVAPVTAGLGAGILALTLLVLVCSRLER
jgi:MFS family permease